MVAEHRTPEEEQFIAFSSQLSDELLAGFERLNQPLTQLVQLLGAPQQTQVRGSDRFTAGNTVWIVPAGTAAAATEALSRVAVIPAQLDRTRLTITATNVFTIVNQTLGYAGGLYLSDRSFVSPGVIPSAGVGVDWYLNQQGYALSMHAFGPASTVEPAPRTLELPTRGEVFIRPVCYVQANTAYFARVDWISHQQLPQPADPADGRSHSSCSSCGG